MQIELPESLNYIDLNADFQKALDWILDDKENVIVTGGAGVGKSEVGKIIRELTKNDFDTIFLAPTGVAAVRIEGQTIHSFFKIPLAITEPYNLHRYQIPELIELLPSIKRIVIDEISFVSSYLFDCVDHLLQKYNHNDKPFGGVQIVIIGDLYQLPPIVKAGSPEQQFMEETYGGHFFFHTEGFKQGNFKKINLSKNYRQNNADFKEVLDRIRVGNQTSDDMSFINRKLVSESIYSHKKESYVYLASFNKTVDAINRSKIDSLDGQKMTFPAKLDGDINPKNFMAPEFLELKKGAKVMLLNNNFPVWVNGTIAYVEEFDLNSQIIEVRLKSPTGELAYIAPIELEEIEYAYGVPSDEKLKVIDQTIVSLQKDLEVFPNQYFELNAKITLLEDSKTKKKMSKKTKGKFTQYPLKLAYAISIWKSQSATYEEVYMDLGYAFAAGQVYVGLSRLTSVEGLGLKKPLKATDIIIHPEVVEFMKTF